MCGVLLLLVSGFVSAERMLTYADVCWVTYAYVCVCSSAGSCEHNKDTEIGNGTYESQTRGFIECTS